MALTSGLRSLCHGWDHLLVTTSSSSQTGHWVNCPTNSLVAAPGSVFIWVIPYLFLAVHPTESPALLLISRAKRCQWLIAGGVWAHAWL